MSNGNSVQSQSCGGCSISLELEKTQQLLYDNEQELEIARSGFKAIIGAITQGDLDTAIAAERVLSNIGETNIELAKAILDLIATQKRVSNNTLSTATEGEKRIQELEERAKRLEEENESLRRDKLTGLYQRHKYENDFREIESKYNLSGMPFSIGIIDIDFFKRVNDKYGHTMGDRVLKLFATEIKKFFGDKDVIYRFGGEEFVILVPRRMEELYEKLEDFRKFFEQQVIVDRRKENIQFRVTFSAGITQYQGQGMEEVFSDTDTLLYHSKKTGRNRITITKDREIIEELWTEYYKERGGE